MLERCPWYVAGPLLGLLMVGLRAALNRPFGALGGFVELVEGAWRSRRLGFRAHLLLGLVLGGTLFAVTTGSFAPALEHASYGVQSLGSTWGQMGLLLVAGTVMGFGARTAGGCTSGHGLSGMCTGSRASLVASMTFFATAVAAAHLVDRLAGAP
jgi:uncharacterized membrane protein YedE/YeeE